MTERDYTTPEALQELELELTEALTGVRPAVRHDCAFCGRERSQADDNHGPDCPYWDLVGGAR